MQPSTSNSSAIPNAAQESNKLAILSLVLGISGMLPPVGILASPTAIILGIIALRRANYTASPRLNRGLAIAGIVSASLIITLYIFVVIAFWNG
jgi:hypothetical protein